MVPEIVVFPETRLAGLRTTTSFSQMNTISLWQKFMPVRMSVQQRENDLVYSIDIYPEGFFSGPVQFERQFDKWAAMNWKDSVKLPDDWEYLTIPAGLYAVFHFRGNQQNAPEFYRNIFMQWLPEAGYVTDDRPHFALMGEKYKNGDPNSEEDIWVPVR